MKIADLKKKMLHHFGKYRLSIEIDSSFAKLMNSHCFLSAFQSQENIRTQYMYFNNYSDITVFKS